MVRNFLGFAALAPIGTAVVALLIVPCWAAGPYDGTWEIVSPAVSGNVGATDVSACDGIKFQIKITDNKVTGRLQRQPYGQARIAESTGSGGSPVTGTVQPDGTVTVQWESYHVTGKLAGNKAELKWTGQCGPRVGTGSRIS
jgi:hypothetical protein